MFKHILNRCIYIYIYVYMKLTHKLREGWRRYNISFKILFCNLYKLYNSFFIMFGNVVKFVILGNLFFYIYIYYPCRSLTRVGLSYLFRICSWKVFVKGVRRGLRQDVRKQVSPAQRFVRRATRGATRGARHERCSHYICVREGSRKGFRKVFVKVFVKVV